MKSINNNAPVKCSKQISIDASPEKVWAARSSEGRKPFRIKLATVVMMRVLQLRLELLW
jgi:hypothetical protein